MPRRYEDDDFDPPARKRTGPGGIALGIIIGGGFLLLVVVGGCVGLLVVLGRGAQKVGDQIEAGQVKARQEEAAKVKRLPTRNELRNLIMDKTQDEVIAAIGKPVKTTEGRLGGDYTWYYEDCSRDPVNDKPDEWVQVIFEGGKVVRINF